MAGVSFSIALQIVLRVLIPPSTATTTTGTAAASEQFIKIIILMVCFTRTKICCRPM